MSLSPGTSVRVVAASPSMEWVASQLHISARTVKFHGTNLLRKLGADSRMGLLKLVLSAEPAPGAQSLSR